MKKTALLAVALATCLAYVPAQAAEVVSSNVVGYQRLDIPAGGYALLANPFVMVGTGTNDVHVGYAINDMFSDDSENSTAGSGLNQADQIQVWDVGRQGYDTYFFSSRITGGGSAWALGTSNGRTPSTVAFDAGDGFWYLARAQAESQITVSGEVATTDVEITISPGYTLLCNPFPADLPINAESIGWGAGATAGSGLTQADQIQLWDIDRQGYDTYFFSSRITGGAWAAGTSNGRTATTDVIPAGQGFWYLHRGENSFTITLKSPIAE